MSSLKSGAAFGVGVEAETKKYYHVWPLKRFREVFVTASGFRPDEDIKAIIYSMGGPFPSEVEKFEYAINVVDGEVKIYITTKEGYNGTR